MICESRANIIVDAHEANIVCDALNVLEALRLSAYHNSTLTALPGVRETV